MDPLLAGLVEPLANPVDAGKQLGQFAALTGWRS